MKINKYVGLFVIVFLFSLSLGFSASFEVNVNTINDNVINASSYAQFKLNLKNTLAIEDRIRLNYDQIQWDINTEPLTLTGIPIKPLSNQEITIKVKPKDVTNIGLYYVPLTVYSEKTKEEKTVFLSVYVGQKFDPEYAPLITAEVNLNNNNHSIDPRKDVLLALTIVNNNVRKYDNIALDIHSDLLNKKENFSLDSKETKKISYKFSLDDKLNPRKDSLTGTIKAAGITFRLPKIDFNIIDYTDKFDVFKDINESWFSRSENYQITNHGNSKSTQNIKIKVDNLRSIFSKFNLDPNYYAIINNTKYAIYEVSLGQDESTTINRVYNFKSLWILFIITLIYCAFNIYTMEDILVIKKIKLHKNKDKAVDKVKVAFLIKNKTKKIFHDLEVADAVPGMFKVESDFPVGSLEPYSVAKSKSHKTIVKWHINELEPKEERLISYEIVAKIPILGSFELPHSIVRYKHRNMAKMVKSNKIDTQKP